MSVYADAYEWVELPNTLGMALFADGGVMASKPYCSSGKYIDRMSDYCKGCRYNVKDTETENACPFNYLYWDFLNRHRDRFGTNPRMAMILRNLDRFSEEKMRPFCIGPRRSGIGLRRMEVMLWSCHSNS